MKTRLALWLACFCIVIGPAMAANDAICRYYGATASQENARNDFQSCGLAGPQWNSKQEYHATWCSGAGIDSVKGEAVSRLHQLNRCNHFAMCEQYTDNALRASEMNQRLQCGFSGPRYVFTRPVHKNWCVSASERSVAAEVRARYDELDRCARCDQYAADAIRFNELRKTRGCKLTGPRWSSEREGHYRWCMDAKPASAVKEQLERARDAADCR